MTAVASTRYLVDSDRLLSIVGRCFEGLGLSPADSRAMADVLVDANLSGVPSNGIQRLPAYMRKVHAGAAGGTERLAVISELGGLCRIDAGDALGPAAATWALNHGIALARVHGVSLVAVGRCTHFGHAGYYARRAALTGMASIVMSNSVKRMAPVGSSTAFLGTNPVGIGIPLGRRDPFVLDMATTVTSGGKILRARDLGHEIPAGIAIDPAGLPTTDPTSALMGSLLPMGGAKGFGLALAVSLFSVLLGGGDCDDMMASLEQDPNRAQNIGQVFILIDVASITPAGASARADGMIDRLIHLPAASESAAGVRYPGQRSAEVARRHSRDGVPVEIGELLKVAKACLELELDDLADELLALGDSGQAG